MADEKLDYAKSAELSLDAAARQERPERVAELQRRAQTFATLALAEQQRIANVIALSQAIAGDGSRPLRHLAMVPVSEYDVGPHPDIAKGLRLEDGVRG